MAKQTKFKMKNIDELIPYARNARTHSAEQVAKIAGSIKEFGFLNPVIISEDGGILAGHGRVLAAQMLGIEEVPCIEESHLTDIQKRAYILADNRLGLDAGWDSEMLSLEFKDLATHLDLAVTGFTDFEIDRYLNCDVGTISEDSIGCNNTELNQDDFADDKFKHTCPRCGMKFND